MDKKVILYNRKGFTLVELLAVIVILAVLALIAMPNVLSLMEKSKKSSFVTEAESFAQYINTAYMNDQISGISSNSTGKSLVKDITVNTKTYDYYCMSYTQLKTEGYVTKSSDSEYNGILEMYTLQSSSSSETIVVVTLTDGSYAINGISLTNLAKGYTEGSSGTVGTLNSGSTLAQTTCATTTTEAASRGSASNTASQFN